MRELNKETIKETDETKLILFSTTWCGPCKMIRPILETITNISVYIIDCDDNRELVQEYDVKSVPTIIGFKDNVEVTRHVGTATHDVIDKIVGECI